MVRLKVALISAVGEVQVFQFQYGTIKRLPPAVTNDAPIRFQFQYGTIKRGRKSLFI